jgi:hypothetical protein
MEFPTGQILQVEPGIAMVAALKGIADSSQPSIPAHVNCLLNTAMIDQVFFNNIYQVNLTVLNARLRLGTLENTANDSTVMLKRTQSNEAPASGDDLLAAAVNLKTGLTANTPLVATLTATGALLVLAPGDGLALDFAGTAATEARNLLVAVRLRVETAS